uniref:Max-like protein X n=1 Tax=Poecilia latipinna TaxID=48699 RepID=A0A3B3V2K1_9TELE
MAGQTDGAFSDNGFDTSFFTDTARKGSIVSRANSIGSTSASSVPNTDDEDSDYRHETSYKDSYKDRRRQAHTQAEQKRRDAIKKGYDDLQGIVPTCQQQSEFAVGAQKISKATILQKTIDYIHFLHKEKKKQEEEVSVLRKEVMALKIMKTNYEHIVKAHQNNPQQGEDQVSDQVKFNIFQNIMDSLFVSFSNSVSMSSFQELSACVFSWIEEHCKPQARTLMDGCCTKQKRQSAEGVTMFVCFFSPFSDAAGVCCRSAPAAQWPALLVEEKPLANFQKLTFNLLLPPRMELKLQSATVLTLTSAHQRFLDRY